MIPSKEWNEFPKTLHNELRKEWNLIISEHNLSLDESCQDDGKLAFAAFLEIYTPGLQAQDTLLTSVEKQSRKPIVVDVQTHWNHVNLIIYYAD